VCDHQHVVQPAHPPRLLLCLEKLVHVNEQVAAIQQINPQHSPLKQRRDEHQQKPTLPTGALHRFAVSSVQFAVCGKPLDSPGGVCSTIQVHFKKDASMMHCSLHSLHCGASVAAVEWVHGSRRGSQPIIAQPRANPCSGDALGPGRHGRGMDRWRQWGPGRVWSPPPAVLVPRDPPSFACSMTDRGYHLSEMGSRELSSFNTQYLICDDTDGRRIQLSPAIKIAKMRGMGGEIGDEQMDR
jgi:hypothetical protein